MMDSLVIHPLKDIIPKEKNGNGFPFPYKPSFTIFAPENEVTLIRFLVHWQNVLIFQDFFVVESWWIWMICVGKNSRVSEESRGLCMWLLLGSNPMFWSPILVASGSGKTDLLKGTLSPPVSFRIQGGGAFYTFAALGLIFPYHKNRSLDFFFFYEGQF